MSIFYCQGWRHVFATSHSPWPSWSLCSPGVSASLWTTEAWPPSRTTSSTAWTPSPVSSRCWWLTRSGSPARSSSPLDTGSPTPSCSGFYKVQVTASFIVNVAWLLILGQPVLYDFLDFQNNLGLALFVVMGCSLILPLIHMGLCHLADKIRDFKMMSNVNKK